MRKKIIVTTAYAIISLNAMAEKIKEPYIVHLPDGTEIKIDGNQAYYKCKGKIVLLPDGAYLLADGSNLTVKKQKITEIDK